MCSAITLSGGRSVSITLREHDSIFTGVISFLSFHIWWLLIFWAGNLGRLDQSTNTAFISHSHGLATFASSSTCAISALCWFLTLWGSSYDPLFQHQDDFCGSALYKCSTHCHPAIFKMMESPSLPYSMWILLRTVWSLLLCLTNEIRPKCNLFACGTCMHEDFKKLRTDISIRDTLSAVITVCSSN